MSKEPASTQQVPRLVDILRLIGKEMAAARDRWIERVAREGYSPEVEKETLFWASVARRVCDFMHEATGLRKSHVQTAILRLGNGEDFDGERPADSCATYCGLLVDKLLWYENG